MPRARRDIPLPRLSPWMVSAVAGVVLVLWAVVAVSGVGFRGMVAGDGRLFLHVGQHPLGPMHGADDSLRYGRILFPALGWLIGLGRPADVAMGLVVVNIGATALLAGGVAALCEQSGGDPRGGFAALAIPIVWGIARFSYGDTLAAALVVLGAVAWLRRNPRLAWPMFALAMLTRETMVFALIPPVFVALRRRDWRRLVLWGSAGVPLVLWWGYVRTKSGQWPPLAHTLQRTLAVSPPFVGIAKAYGPRGYPVAATFAVVTIVVGVLTAIFLRRVNAAWPFALVFGGSAALLGPNVFPGWGDTLRLLLPAHAFILPGLVNAVPAIKRRLRGDGGLPAAPTVHETLKIR
jgi:hypothetical protein